MTLDQDNQQKRPRNLLFILFEDSALILKLYGATVYFFDVFIVVSVNSVAI